MKKSKNLKIRKETIRSLKTSFINIDELNKFQGGISGPLQSVFSIIKIATMLKVPCVMAYPIISALLCKQGSR